MRPCSASGADDAERGDLRRTGKLLAEKGTARPEPFDFAQDRLVEGRGLQWKGPFHPSTDLIERGAHLAYRRFDPDEHGAGDDRVADVELGDFRDCGDGSHVVESKTVTGVDDEAAGRGQA